MRSRILHACRPLRASSPSLPCLGAASRRQAPSLVVLGRRGGGGGVRCASQSSGKPAPRPVSTSNNKAGTGGALDPQAAIPQAATVEDVDPELAGQIPTPEGGGSGTPTTSTSAFVAALSGNGSGSGTSTMSAGGEPGKNGQGIDWSSSFHGLSTTPFSPETAEVLMQPLDPLDIEIKPDGIIYLPEIKYRRILNKAFGPGGWGLAPRGELVVGEKVVTREYALVVHGRYVSLSPSLSLCLCVCTRVQE